MYVPANFLDHILKNVRRQRGKADEDLTWARFVNRQELNNSKCTTHECMSSMERFEKTSCQRLNCVEQPAKISEKDLLSDRSNNIWSSSAMIANFKSVTQEKLWDGKNGTIQTKNLSAADRIPKKETIYSRDCLYTMENCKYDSSHALSTNNDRCINEAVSMRVDPTVAEKIIAKQKKISELLDEILYRLHKIPLPDGERDMQRRQQRVMEFSIRFSRNYLYELHRYITTLRQHIHSIFLCVKMKSNQRNIAFHAYAIEQKLISAHQLLLYALVAYCKHIPSSIIKEEPSKLKELLQVVIDLKDISNKVHLEANCFGSGDDGKSLEIDLSHKCNIILSKLSSNFERDSQVICHNTQILRSSERALPRCKKSSSHKNLYNRLRVYNTDVKSTKIRHKKKLSTCPSKDSKCDITTGKALSTKSSLTLDKATPTPIMQVSPKETNSKIMQRFASLREDDIDTMMDFIPINIDNKTETNENSEPKVTPNSAYAKCDTLQAASREHAYECVSSKTNSLENVKLVYVSSMKSTSDTPHRHDVSCQADGESFTSPFSCKNTVHRRSEIEHTLSPYKSIGIIISEAVKFRFLTWRKEHQRFLQANPMYSTNTRNKPWDIVIWISDKLVDELIIEIAKELELDDLIQKLFKLEFEEY